METKKNTAAQAGKSFGSMFKRLFKREKRSVLEEEAIQTPTKMVMKNFFRNKLGVAGLIIFIAFLLFAFVGSQIVPLVETYTELPLANVPPGTTSLKFPKTLNGSNVVKIANGASFGAALTTDGKVEVWGVESNIEVPGSWEHVTEIPEAIQAQIESSNIIDMVTGGMHVLLLDDQGNVFGWGYYGHGQTSIPDDVLSRMGWSTGIDGQPVKAKQILASTNWSAIIGSDKQLYIWGSTQTVMNFRIPSAVKGHIEKGVAADNNIALLLDDGTVYMLGDPSTEYYCNVPEELKDGSVKVVDIECTNRNVIALDDQGKLWTWGASADGLLNVPEMNSNIVKMVGGYRHFTVLLEDGSVVSWGANELGQCDVPEGLGKIVDVYSDYYQNYAIDEAGNIHAWGHKGFVFGSDQFGRDMMTRLIHGGRISLTVGAIAVGISTIIALIVGLAAGYFGGWVDMLLMRLTEIFSAIPFYPIAITLSYAIGNSLSQSAKLYLIMVILGVLGWMGLARTVRALLLVEREKDFVLAARALGLKQNKIMWRHILPNVFSYVIVNIALSYSSYILTEAGLSFLGFGVCEPTPSWGNMLTSAQQSTVVQYYWWRWFIPGLFVVVASFSANLIGDALRDAMDPKSNER